MHSSKHQTCGLVRSYVSSSSSDLRAKAWWLPASVTAHNAAAAFKLCERNDVDHLQVHSSLCRRWDASSEVWDACRLHRMFCSQFDGALSAAIWTILGFLSLPVVRLVTASGLLVPQQCYLSGGMSASIFWLIPPCSNDRGVHRCATVSWPCTCHLLGRCGLSVLAVVA
jgi:hypothetical protein